MTACVLTPSVQAELYAVAESWQQQKNPQATRRKSTRYTDLELAYMGVQGEYVVAQLYGVHFNGRSYGAQGDDGVDVFTPTAGAVKTTHLRDGHLIVERWGDLAKVEIIHLVAGPCERGSPCRCVAMPPVAERVWCYAGWITVVDFRRRSHLADWGLGPRRYLRQSELEPGLADHATAAGVGRVVI